MQSIFNIHTGGLIYSVIRKSNNMEKLSIPIYIGYKVINNAPRPIEWAYKESVLSKKGYLTAKVIVKSSMKSTNSQCPIIYEWNAECQVANFYFIDMDNPNEGMILKIIAWIQDHEQRVREDIAHELQCSYKEVLDRKYYDPQWKLLIVNLIE